MSVPRSVAEVLYGHVTLEVEGINRMYRAGSIDSVSRRAKVEQILCAPVRGQGRTDVNIRRATGDTGNVSVIGRR